jgi:hypothetical protein
MRKRELEKLLFQAVADALGVETKSAKRRELTRAPVHLARKSAQHVQHRAAA